MRFSKEAFLEAFPATHKIMGVIALGCVVALSIQGCTTGVQPEHDCKNCSNKVDATCGIDVVCSIADPNPNPHSVPEPKNYTTVKIDTPPALTEYVPYLKSYYASGDYMQGVAKVDKEAEDDILKYAAEHRRPDGSYAEPYPALVLDIDETALSNWPAMKANDLEYYATGACNFDGDNPVKKCGAFKWDESQHATAIKPTLQLFKTAQASGIAVFFITGRPNFEDGTHVDETRWTDENLKKEGYAGYAHLFMRGDDKGDTQLKGEEDALACKESASRVARYKAFTRSQLEDGTWGGPKYDIIANVGDQYSDMACGYADQTYKLPNPFYLLP